MLLHSFLAAVGHWSAVPLTTELSTVFAPGRSVVRWPGQAEPISAGGCFMGPALLHVPGAASGSGDGTLLL
eukprot:SAG31_NODE_25084_length_468_cov_0.840108_2_plen_70_part_01